MSFFAILFALLIEQVRPLARDNLLHGALRSWAEWVAHTCDTGRAGHAALAWSVALLVPTLGVLLVHVALVRLLGWPAAMVWSVAVLYATLGFRQFSHHFTAIRDALDDGDEDRARELLAAWQQVDASELPRSEIVRHVIEYSVIAAHRHVFGVLGWFSVFAAFGLGPLGAVAYRMAELLARIWRQRRGVVNQPASAALDAMATRAWLVIDWLPARVTALVFAVVGSFEEAIEGWRYHARRFPNDNDGVILAATSGAIGVRLGGGALREALPQADLADADAAPGGTSTPGRPPEVGHLAQVVGLVWRSVVVWMVLLALLTLARLLG